jgi:hypothetical protein
MAATASIQGVKSTEANVDDSAERNASPTLAIQVFLPTTDGGVPNNRQRQNLAGI